MKIKDKEIGEIFSELKNINILQKKYYIPVLIYTVLALLSTVFGILTSLVSQSLIDFVTKSATENNILKFANIYQVVGAAVAFAVFRILFSAFNGRVSEKIRLKINTEMTADIFDKFLCSKWEFTSMFSSGDVLNRFNSDISAVAGSVIGIAPTFLTKIFQFIATFSVIFYYDKIMALIALVSIPLSLICSRLLVKKLHKYAKELKLVNSKISSFNADALLNMQYLKSFGLVTVFCAKLRKIQKEYIKLSLDYNKLSVIITAIMSFITQIVSYACFGWGVYRLWQGDISFGTLVLFIQLYSMLSSSFSGLINVVPTLINASAASARLTEIKNLPKDDAQLSEEDVEFFNSEKNNKITLSLESVTFKYAGDEDDALKSISFSAKSGDFVALTGPSGEGKTTMLRIFLSLVSPCKGKAVITSNDGKTVEISPSTRCFFSYVPQKNTMFSDTLSENMRLVKEDATDEEITSALKTACAYDFIKNEKNGINCFVGDGGVGFSEGQLQRLSIARALLRNAPIVLFDEATSALDADTEKAVMKNISEWGKDKICIFTSHRPSVFEVCNKAYIVNGNDCIPIM